MKQPGPPAEILVVDDDPDVLELLSELLREQGYATKAARNSQQALDCLDHGCPALVITDLMMPGDSGAVLLKKLSRLPGADAVPSIMLTAAGAQAAHEALAAAGVSTQLCHKPIRIQAFLRLVRRLLDETPGPLDCGAEEVSASAGRGSGPRQSPR